MSKAQELIEKYNLKANSYYIESPYGSFRNSPEGKATATLGNYKNVVLNRKWKDRIPKGWYGFDLGYPVLLFFYDVIDEFLEYVETVCPDFEIHQIKSKYSSIRIYLGNVGEEINREIDELTAVMEEKYLIY